MAGHPTHSPVQDTSAQWTRWDGGDLHVEVGITSELLDIGKAYNAVLDDGCGAVASFVGTTRDNHNGKSVVRLEYEAHSSMAAAMMLELAKKAAQQSGNQLRRIYMVHRIGPVLVREASILITVSSPHREAALAAVAWLIDQVKATVPVWKKEWYADGSGQWKRNSECCWAGNRSQSAVEAGSGDLKAAPPQAGTSLDAPAAVA